MKVVHVLPLSLDLYGLSDTDIGDAVKFFLTNICKFQGMKGFRVTAYLISSNNKYLTKNCREYQVKFVPVDLSPPFSLTKYRFGHQISIRLVLRVLMEKPDIVHFHGFMQHHIMYSMLTILSKICNFKIVAHHQGIVEETMIERLLNAVANRLVDMVIVTNKNMGEYLLRRSIERSRIVFVPNGVDTEIFFPMDKKLAKSLLSFDGNDLLVLWVGRLSRQQKDAFTVVRAVNELRNDGLSTKLIIVGQGEDADTLRKDVLLNAQEYVMLIGDFLKQEDLRLYYNAADIFVLNSSLEGMPQVVIEAMACKTPVVVSDIPGNRELASDVGILFPFNDLSALKKSLAILVRNEKLRKRMGEEGYEKVIKHYSWEKISENIAREVYLRIDRSSNRRRGTEAYRRCGAEIIRTEMYAELPGREDR